MHEQGASGTRARLMAKRAKRIDRATKKEKQYRGERKRSVGSNLKYLVAFGSQVCKFSSWVALARNYKAKNQTNQKLLGVWEEEEYLQIQAAWVRSTHYG